MTSRKSKPELDRMCIRIDVFIENSFQRYDQRNWKWNYEGFGGVQIIEKRNRFGSMTYK